MNDDSSIPYLSQANFVGNGYDITGSYNIPKSLTLQLLNPSKAEKVVFNFLGNDYYIPAYIVSAENTQGNLEEGVGETREEIQNILAMKTGVEASYGAFSGHIDASYGKEYAQSTQFFYAFSNFFSHLAILSINKDEAMKVLSTEFLQACNALPEEATLQNLPEFYEFFKKFGLYYTSSIYLGASFQYYVTVKKMSNLIKKDISVNMGAEVTGLIASGKINAEVQSSEAWKSYISNRHVKIVVSGGDPNCVINLSCIDPSNPSRETVNAYKEWANSIKKSPAIADFLLSGIWELIPDTKKSKAVRDAFIALQTKLRPKLYIETGDGPFYKPVVHLEKNLKAENTQDYSSGFQLIVLDRSNISPEGVLYNRYYGVENITHYFDEVVKMFDAIMNDIETLKYNTFKYVVILVSYGWVRNAPPNSTILPFLYSTGGGEILKSWVENCEPGQQMLSYSASYIFVGIPQMGPGTAVETFKQHLNSATSKPIQITQEILFYIPRGYSQYTLYAGSSTNPRINL